MAKPIILTVDDEPQVLNAVERDLRRHYRGDYRIVKAASGPRHWRLCASSNAAMRLLPCSWPTSACRP